MNARDRVEYVIGIFDGPKLIGRVPITLLGVDSPALRRKASGMAITAYHKATNTPSSKCVSTVILNSYEDHARQYAA